ncbi:Hydroxyacylglutathione hydrolase [uncultured Candidatus Thioglobus sp.]|nr:Hydroxyacylglutathione hydrolase [uncultured Candidatus Thioglobus sp.]
MQNFVYLVEDIATKHCAIFDPAWNLSKPLSLVAKNAAVITDIFLTHSHADHTNGIEQVLNVFDAELHLSHAESKFWRAEKKSTLHYGGDIIQLGMTAIEILHTPGHTCGSVCYKINGHLITGDTMFVFGCGHCKLGGDPNILFDTLRSLRTNLPADTVIYPGHNYAEKATSTMDEQIQGNPFLHFEKSEDFVDFRQNVHSQIRNTPYQALSKTELEAILKKHITD